MKWTYSLVFAAAVLGTLGAGALTVDMEELPQPAQIAIQAEKQGFRVGLIDKRLASGKNAYDVELISGSETAHLVVTEEGRVTQDSRKGTYRPPADMPAKNE